MLICFCGGSGLRGLWKELFRTYAQTTSNEPPNNSPPQVVIIVAVSDDGGSSRAIMNAVGGLPVGDCRNVALTVVGAMLDVLADLQPSMTLQYEGQRHIHALLSHRLCAVDATKAREECVHSYLLQFRDLAISGRDSGCSYPEKSGAWWQLTKAAEVAHAALLLFLRCVGEGSSQDDNEPTRSFPSINGGAKYFSFRNASIGNLVLAGLLFMELQLPSEPRRGHAPLYNALQRFLNEILGWGLLCKTLGLVVDIAPSLDYCTADGSSVAFPLPTVSIEVHWADGSTTWGQRAISYGRSCQGEDDPLVVSKHHQHTHHRHFEHHGCPAALNTWWKPGASDIAIVPSPVVTNFLAQASSTVKQSSAILCRGSLLTSTIAAAAPHLGPILEASCHEHADTLRIIPQPSTQIVSAILMVNGWHDRETLPYAASESTQPGAPTAENLNLPRLLETIETLLPRCQVERLWLPIEKEAISADTSLKGPKFTMKMEYIGSANEPKSFDDSRLSSLLIELLK
jgi:hypothetical protein